MADGDRLWDVRDLWIDSLKGEVFASEDQILRRLG
jgi:hypothetical protein